MTEKELIELIRQLVEMLKGIYKEQTAYQAFFEYVKRNPNHVNADEILEQARHDPAIPYHVAERFRDYDELILLLEPQSDAVRRQALYRSLLDQWQSSGKPN
jgi:hypothetical protein